MRMGPGGSPLRRQFNALFRFSARPYTAIYACHSVLGRDNRVLVRARTALERVHSGLHWFRRRHLLRLGIGRPALRVPSRRVARGVGPVSSSLLANLTPLSEAFADVGLERAIANVYGNVVASSASARRGARPAPWPAGICGERSATNSSVEGQSG